ncbi:putative hexapeptide transferase family protein [Anaplasma centrale str. Israel]|uniref:Putative hexapeptide transferase family protein n=1 Tax=Anaplasma centrale (strain Israel) TaxID=574556 RepID=D1ATR6_ANACI|nr:gamma carbonic anhydrase family protein [Anaplasma centrale]ACZ48944.1 putative hexapeptide transferase family protein [Anaplasma centrale str. Israel]
MYGGYVVGNASLASYMGVLPSVDSTAFVADNARLIGRVAVGKNASIWFCSVLRGDVGKIVVGEGSNIQDNTVVHTDQEYGDTEIGKFVTVGHGCILHACSLMDKTFVGMGCVIMDRALMEECSMLAAGSLLTRGKVVKSGELWGGRPAKYMRMLSDQELAYLQQSADGYIELSRSYL